MTVLGILGFLLFKPVLVLAGAYLFALACRRQPAVVRHAIWAAALAALLALPAMSSLLPRIRVAALAPTPPPVLSESQLAPSVVPVSPSLEQALSTNPERGTRSLSWLSLVLAIWVSGMLLKVIRRLNAESRLRNILERSAPPSPRLRNAFERAAKHLGVHRPVTLRLTEAVASPAAFGMFKPVVLLPVESEGWPAPSLRAAMNHELGHVVRWDAVINLMADLVALLYWPNPVVHSAVRRLRAESERACDDRVLRAGASPDRYAQLLVRLAAMESRKRDASWPALAMARVGELEQRLVAVLDDTIHREPVPARRVRALAGAVLALALPVATLTPVPRSLGPRGPEPDRQEAALASPSSERLPIAYNGFQVPEKAAEALHGPDSLLIQTLIAGVDHVPQNEADLIRERAYWALTRIEHAGLIEPLIASLQDPDWRVQSYAAWTLGLVHEPRAIPRLEALLSHPVWRLRAMAAATLRSAADPHSLTAMTRALNDPAWQVRLEAVEYLALVPLSDAARSELLSPFLRDRHIAVRHAAEQALNR